MADQQSPEPVATGWDSWERYFVRVYGPNWRDKRRCGHNGRLCAYCSGQIKAKESKRGANEAVRTAPSREPDAIPSEIS